MSRSFEGEKAMLKVTIENEDTGGGFTATLMTLEDGFIGLLLRLRLFLLSRIHVLKALHENQV